MNPAALRDVHRRRLREKWRDTSQAFPHVSWPEKDSGKGRTESQKDTWIKSSEHTRIPLLKSLACIDLHIGCNGLSLHKCTVTGAANYGSGHVTTHLKRPKTLCTVRATYPGHRASAFVTQTLHCIRTRLPITTDCCLILRLSEQFFLGRSITELPEIKHLHIWIEHEKRWGINVLLKYSLGWFYSLGLTSYVVKYKADFTNHPMGTCFTLGGHWYCTLHLKTFAYWYTWSFTALVVNRRKYFCSMKM